jgi:hypothetical protein
VYTHPRRTVSRKNYIPSKVKNEGRAFILTCVYTSSYKCIGPLCTIKDLVLYKSFFSNYVVNLNNGVVYQYATSNSKINDYAQPRFLFSRKVRHGRVKKLTKGKINKW